MNSPEPSLRAERLADGHQLFQLTTRKELVRSPASDDRLAPGLRIIFPFVISHLRDFGAALFFRIPLFLSQCTGLRGLLERKGRMGALALPSVCYLPD